jgi:flagellin
MGLFVNTNVSSLNARRHVFTSEQAFNSSFKRLSSGFNIHRASITAAALKISNLFTTLVQGLHQTVQNTNLSGHNAGGAIGGVITSLQGISNPLVQFKNGINSSDVYSSLQKEVQTSKKDSGHILSDTHFTNLDILHRHFSAKFLVHENGSQTISVNLSLKSDLDIAAADIVFAESTCVALIAISIDGVCSEMGDLHNSFQFTTPNSRNISESVTGFRIHDTVLGSEIAELARNQQACLSVLSREKQGLQSAFSKLS